MRHLLSKSLLSVLAFAGCFGLGVLLQYAGQQKQVEYRAPVASVPLPRVVNRVSSVEVLRVELVTKGPLESMRLVLRNNGSRPIKSYTLECRAAPGTKYVQTEERADGHTYMPGEAFVIDVPYASVRQAKTLDVTEVVFGDGT